VINFRTLDGGNVSAMAAPRRPDPPPFQTNEFAPVIVATGLWLVAFFVLLTQHHSLASHGHGWYVWVGLSGFLLGLWGLSLMWLRRRGIQRAQSRSASASSNDEGTTPRSSSVAK
jgi:protein-S-isoprenylcysteine O-methyltransferase Ste14